MDAQQILALNLSTLSSVQGETSAFLERLRERIAALQPDDVASFKREFAFDLSSLNRKNQSTFKKRNKELKS